VLRQPSTEHQALITDVAEAAAAQQTIGGASVTVGVPTYNRANLLRETIESVLGQTYHQFRLIVSDNASTDDTSEVVASLSDPRLEYVRADENIGMTGNFNRLIALADTEFLMLLPDDDRLYPDYLRSVVEVLQRHPQVGLVQTGFDEIDLDSRVRKRAVGSAGSHHSCTVEPGRAYLERSMTSHTLCQSATTYRTRAIREARGLLPSEEPFADIPLFMRMARTWDVAYIDRPLVAFRVHEQTETARLAARGQDEHDARNRLLTYARIMFDRRMDFLDEAGLPNRETRRYRSLAGLRFLADRAGLGAPWRETWTSFIQIVRLYPPILSHPIALRFVAAQCGGRRLRRATSALAPVVD
jgi:glycosyltransferase involved in cell wall biosynthesis